MAAAIALNGTKYFGESVSRVRSAEKKALDFFRRADSSTALETVDGISTFRDSANPPANPYEKALAFFTRAELSDTLQGIWDTIKRLPLSTVLKLLKAAALVTAVILLTQSISLPGFLALAGAIAGLLFAAISNVLVWLIYAPLYAVRTSDFAFSILLALGLAWLGGVSPLILFGFRLAERSELANQNVSDIVNAVRDKLEPVNLGAGLQKAAASLAGFASSIFPSACQLRTSYRGNERATL